MKLSEINEYAQTIAGVVAIAGIVFVGVQIQQSNQFAEADFVAEFYDTHLSQTAIALESDLYATIAKSVEAPSQLTLEELLELDAFYESKLHRFDKAFTVATILEILTDGQIEFQLRELTRNAKAEFPGEFGRAWVENAVFPSEWPFKTALLKGLNDTSTEAQQVRLMELAESAQR